MASRARRHVVDVGRRGRTVTAAQAREHRAAERIPSQMMLRILRAELGEPLAATLSGAVTVATLDAWINGDVTVDSRVDRQLRGAYAIAEMLLEVDSAEVVRAWFLGMNPLLDDRAPAMVLPEDPIAVQKAALFFVANG